MVISEPRVADEARADWLSFEVLNRYANIKPKIMYGALLNPLMEIGDPISVLDDNKQTIDEGTTLWLTSITDRVGKTSLADYEPTAYKPWQSYVPRIDIELEEYDRVPVANLTINNRGNIAGALTTPLTTGATTIEVDSTAGAPSEGYLLLSGASSKEWVYYGGKTSTSYTSCERAQDWRDYQVSGSQESSDFDTASSGQAFATATTTVHAYYDPYLSEEDGTLVEVTFDLVVSGEVRVEVFGASVVGLGGARVACPTTSEGKEGAAEEFQWHEAGRDKKFVWGGVDLYGRWNKYVWGLVPREDDRAPFYYVGEREDDVDRGYDYGRFYIRVEVRPPGERPYRITTEAADSSGYNSSLPQFVYTKRGPSGQADFEMPHKKHNESSYSDYTGYRYWVRNGGENAAPTRVFEDSDNDGVGIKLQANSRSLATVGGRSVVRCIKAKSWGGRRHTWLMADGLVYSRVRYRSGSITEDIPEEYIVSEEENKDYQTSVRGHFAPRDYYVYNNWRGLFEESQELSKGYVNIFGNRVSWDDITALDIYAAWMFSFNMDIIDNSGRSFGVSSIRMHIMWIGAEYDPDDMLAIKGHTMSDSNTVRIYMEDDDSQLDYGVVTASSAVSLADSTKSWAAGEFDTYIVIMVTGDLEGTWKRIRDTLYGNTLQINEDWDIGDPSAKPAVGDAFGIYGGVRDYDGHVDYKNRKHDPRSGEVVVMWGVLIYEP